MDLPIQLQSLTVKDIQATHMETGNKVWFRKKTNWAEIEMQVLHNFFPDEKIVHEGNLYLCGAAQVDGLWILGWLHPDNYFEPL